MIIFPPIHRQNIEETIFIIKNRDWDRPLLKNYRMWWIRIRENHKPCRIDTCNIVSCWSWSIRDSEEPLEYNRLRYDAFWLAECNRGWRSCLIWWNICRSSTRLGKCIFIPFTPTTKKAYRRALFKSRMNSRLCSIVLPTTLRICGRQPQKSTRRFRRSHYTQNMNYSRKRGKAVQNLSRKGILFNIKYYCGSIANFEVHWGFSCATVAGSIAWSGWMKIFWKRQKTRRKGSCVNWAHTSNSFVSRRATMPTLKAVSSTRIGFSEREAKRSAQASTSK